MGSLVSISRDKSLDAGRRASTLHHGFLLDLFSFSQMLVNRFFIKLVGLAFHDFKGSGGALAQTGTEPVTQLISNNPGFAVYNLQRTFGTGRHAQTAAVAQFFIDFDYFPQYFHDQLLFLNAFARNFSTTSGKRFQGFAARRYPGRLLRYNPVAKYF
jgi:hypothetical protein